VTVTASCCPNCGTVAATFAVNRVADTNVVATPIPSRNTCAAGTNPLPFTVKVELPAGTHTGRVDATTGYGFCNETITRVFATFIAVLVAVTNTVLGTGNTAGGVYSPLSEIVPGSPFPPTGNPTDQRTDFTANPVTVAANCTDFPTRTTGADGVTVTNACPQAVANSNTHKLTICPTEAVTH
jgi:hypothetical protein